MLAKKLESAAKAVEPVYIEDVFSTYLYTGNGSTQTINNGIDLAGKGGLVWLKQRNTAQSHGLFDTVRGAPQLLMSNSTSGQTPFAGVSAFTSSGFSLGDQTAFNDYSPATYASWTFRKQPKFFDVVTWTGNDTPRVISHNLGSVPGCIIVKSTTVGTGWVTYHRSLGADKFMYLNETSSAYTDTNVWNNTAPTATGFSLGGSMVNNWSGQQYVAYLFAHDAGGFGLTGTDNVISCGSYTGNGSTTGPVIDLGYEPQWVMIKRATGGTGNWGMFDNMRGLPTGGDDAELRANTSEAENSAAGNQVDLTATGFQLKQTYSGINASDSTYIYIAIRRGPMKTPTSGTSVFAPDYFWGTNSNVQGYLGAPADFHIGGYLAGSASNARVRSRLTGKDYLTTSSTAAETVDTFGVSYWDNMLGFLQASGSTNTSFIGWMFRRAPGFFDEVCYTGTGSTRYVDHNLTVAPELLIVKNRSAAPEDWSVYAAPLGNTSRLKLNLTDAVQTGVTHWGSTTPTATQFRVGTQSSVNGSGNNLVAYLFASCPGVSKVGSFTNSGSDVNVDCGFTAGARFILIKRSSGADDWYVYDSARGITTGNDPYLTLNTTAAEVTNSDGIAPLSSGFTLKGSQWNTGTYIFLAIA